jgi:hypothetical protein
MGFVDDVTLDQDTQDFLGEGIDQDMGSDTSDPSISDGDVSGDDSQDTEGSDSDGSDQGSDKGSDEELFKDIEKYLDLGLRTVSRVVDIVKGRKTSPKPIVFDDPIPLPTGGKKPKALPPKRDQEEESASKDDQDIAVIEDMIGS